MRRAFYPWRLHMILKYPLVPLFLVLVLGCSKAENKTANASVSGEVTFKGKLVKGGTVTFHPVSGPSATAFIQADGTYSVTDVIPGEMVATIETESAAGKRGKAVQYGEAEGKKYEMSPRPDYAKGKTATFEYTKIPEKYANKNRSGLAATLTSGRNTKNF